MTEYTVDSYLERQAGLDAARAVFLAAGGVIEILPGPGSKLRPAHQASEWNGSLTKRPAKAVPPPPVEYHRTPVGWRGNPEMVERLRELSSSMHCRQAAEAVGISDRTARDIARLCGFKFVSKAPERPTGNGVVIDPSNDAAVVERIKVLRDIGLSRNQTWRHIGISNTLFSRLMRDYQIDFPKSKPGREAMKKAVFA